MTVTDLFLAHRLEQTEALANRNFVNARALLEPESGATWMQFAGGYAMYDGVGSPLTQVFALGVREIPTESDFRGLEAFFDERGADTVIEVCPMAHASVLQWIAAHGYTPVEFSTVLHREIDSPVASHGGGLTVRVIDPAERSLWADRSAEGWASDPAFAGMIRALAWVSAHATDNHCFVAELDGGVVATGGLAIHDDVALLAGASTIPAFRGRGAQGALLSARLEYARSAGCTVAMLAAAPGSTSQINAERKGFRIAYTRLKWSRPASTVG
jgi:GNAT superfamily N-acetyltransferase